MSVIVCSIILKPALFSRCGAKGFGLKQRLACPEESVQTAVPRGDEQCVAYGQGRGVDQSCTGSTWNCSKRCCPASPAWRCWSTPRILTSPPFCTKRCVPSGRLGCTCAAWKSAMSRDWTRPSVLIAVPVEALIVAPDTLLLSQRHRIVEFANKHRLPVISEIKAFAEAGGLLIYGASLLAQWQRAAYYVDRLLKGAKPDELPVERPTTFELVIYLQTAKALGLTISPMLLFQADEVLQ
jgi:hypothetical protein